MQATAHFTKISFRTRHIGKFWCLEGRATGKINVCKFIYGNGNAVCTCVLLKCPSKFVKHTSCLTESKMSSIVRCNILLCATKEEALLSILMGRSHRW